MFLPFLRSAVVSSSRNHLSGRVQRPRFGIWAWKKPCRSDSKCLALSITLYMATGSIPAQQSPAPMQPLPTSAVINTARTSPPRAVAATTPVPASSTAIVISSPSASPLKRKAQMMHDDLEPLLNGSMFCALDAYVNASIKSRESLPQPRRLKLL
jgi:hypothetical protein